MENPILITWLNDYVFCPRSIYFHNLYGETERLSFQDVSQINGTKAHETIDKASYSSRKDIISGLSVFSEKYNLIGKIDIFDRNCGALIERKKKIKTVYDGYVFQLYGQCFALREMGYTVNSLTLRSLDDNKKFRVELPENDIAMFLKFEQAIKELEQMDITSFQQKNREKCLHCIENSERILNNITADLNNKFIKTFDETDSVYIIRMNPSCKIERYGYAKHEEDDIMIVT